MKISRIHLASASAEKEENHGILGYVSFVIDGILIVDSVVLRRRADGGRTLSYPSRLDSTGLRHPYLSPTDDAARLHIEREVFRALGIEEGARR